MGDLHPPRTRPLSESSYALNDRVELDRIWREQGYLFFRDVIDRRAVARLRRVFIDELISRGVVDAGADSPLWNGADLTEFPIKIETLHDRRVWLDLAAEPAIVALFERIQGGPVHWVPIVEYRLQPPRTAQAEDPWVTRHQDGFSNPGLPYRTAWIPLMALDEMTGGVAVAPSLVHAGTLHDLSDPPQYAVPRAAVPDDAWHFSPYDVGDVVIISADIPHAGMPNYSRYFRLSVDIRFMRPDEKVPFVGRVKEIAADRLVAEDDLGCAVSFEIDDDSYLRGNPGRRLTVDELRAVVPIGSFAVIASESGKLQMIRPRR